MEVDRTRVDIMSRQNKCESTEDGHCEVLPPALWHGNCIQELTAAIIYYLYEVCISSTQPQLQYGPARSSQEPIQN